MNFRCSTLVLGIILGIGLSYPFYPNLRLSIFPAAVIVLAGWIEGMRAIKTGVPVGDQNAGAITIALILMNILRALM